MPRSTAEFGIYRARADAASGESRRFRLLLWAEPPDRLHAEALSPLGPTEMIVDAGGGRVAITFPRDGVSYQGASSPRALESLLGVPIDVERLVRALLEGTGDPHGAPQMIRRGTTGAGLPERFEILGAGVRLRLRRKGIEPLESDPGRLGTGEPPAGTRVRPLEELR